MIAEPRCTLGSGRTNKTVTPSDTYLPCGPGKENPFDQALGNTGGVGGSGPPVDPFLVSRTPDHHVITALVGSHRPSPQSQELSSFALKPATPPRQTWMIKTPADDAAFQNSLKASEQSETRALFSESAAREGRVNHIHQMWR